MTSESIDSDQPDVDQLFGLANNAGLFDTEYYSASCNRSFGSDLAAFRDYLDRGLHTEVNPSPAFDSMGYLRAHRDVYDNNEHPFVHYLTNQADAAALTRMQPLPSWSPATVIDDVGPVEFTGRIAVQLHAYYPDVVERMSRILATLRFRADLFVSVPNETIRDLALGALSDLEPIDNFVVRVVPNRGRNFGPLLVAFRDELESVDLVCHVHSKKSLFSGREQRQWSDYLYEYLLGDQRIVQQVLAQFERDDSVGAVYPTTFSMLASLANHWGSNTEQGSDLAERLGKPEIPTAGFVNYPVGGMFWARTDAIRQLFDHRFSYEDFPEEPVESDGTMLHALERILGGLAASNGYKQLFADTRTGELTSDGTFIYRDYVRTISNFERVMWHADVMSFSLFDGLLYRTEPAGHAIVKIARILESAGICSEKTFVELYQKANQAEAGAGPSVSRLAIYERVVDAVDLPRWLAPALARWEFTFTLDAIRPRTEIVDVVNRLCARRPDRQVWICARGRFEPAEIAQFVARAGLQANYRVFAESEIGAAQGSSAFWSKLRGELAPDQKLFHCGSDLPTDYFAPVEAGVRSVTFLDPQDKIVAARLGRDPGITPVSESASHVLAEAVGRYPFLAPVSTAH